jgi:hypothetical protein
MNPSMPLAPLRMLHATTPGHHFKGHKDVACDILHCSRCCCVCFGWQAVLHSLRAVVQACCLAPQALLLRLSGGASALMPQRMVLKLEGGSIATALGRRARATPSTLM